MGAYAPYASCMSTPLVLSYTAAMKQGRFFRSAADRVTTIPKGNAAIDRLILWTIWANIEPQQTKFYDSRIAAIGSAEAL